MFLNIFIRESKPLPRKGQAAPKSQQSNEPKHYYSASIVCDDGSFENLGIIKVIKQAKEVLELAVKEEITTPGETDKGSYEMVTVEIKEESLVKIGNKYYLKAIEQTL